MGDHSGLSPHLCDYNYHLDRAEAERHLARLAWSVAARDAHHRLAELHEAAAREQWHEHVLLSPETVPVGATPQQIDTVGSVLASSFG